jgi:transposase
MGVLDRLILRDDQWDQMSRYIIGDDRTRGSSGRDNRMFVEAVLWIVRTGSPWRDLPDVFGDWNSVFRRFSRWSQKGVWWRLFEAMSDDSDFEYLIVDSTIIRAHQHASGAKKGLKIRPRFVNRREENDGRPGRWRGSKRRGCQRGKGSGATVSERRWELRSGASLEHFNTQLKGMFQASKNSCGREIGNQHTRHLVLMGGRAGL